MTSSGLRCGTSSGMDWIYRMPLTYTTLLNEKCGFGFQLSVSVLCKVLTPSASSRVWFASILLTRPDSGKLLLDSEIDERRNQMPEFPQTILLLSEACLTEASSEVSTASLPDKVSTKQKDKRLILHNQSSKV
ncbi:hypothetical protein KQX54_011008 [Cotesia glomerata]|uniref:Uncharacterized protein n=1 Tax=Cotesia glomerata TaxID=32391 RepID=A0AAV7J0X2_COTGL|nr:hypothetical protein KQX54_011008 [Cotesia glomerata]